MAQTCSRPSEITAAVSAAAVQVEGKENLARSAYACGHFWSAANLQEKSLAENQNALERFNLAAAYARTGRYDQAEALYQSVVGDGEYLNVRMDTAATEPGARPEGFNLADEATRRLAGVQLLRRLYERPGAETPQSALDVGTNAADVGRSVDGSASPAVRGPESANAGSGLRSAEASGVDVLDISAGGSVSDQEALQRDGLALEAAAFAGETPSR